MKFLVIWRIHLALLSEPVLKSILKMQDYAAQLQRKGKLSGRYHIPGSHGGAWIYEVGSNEELDRLLAQSPTYNFAEYDVYPLAEMTQASGSALSGREA